MANVQPTVLILNMSDGKVKVYGPYKSMTQALDRALLRPTDGSVKSWYTADLLDPETVGL